ncbi:hypothetical protein NBRC111894_2896 [Sporolactobacillus inulinus]|uniref:Hydrolase n=1 Tax=Sporolactobacillus inulinus TaxID=2078 RepID=A0A4Y1ZDY4_9BACL|nr:HAD hydrolase family protein [Sporolactobacillus inulinus]GAY77342.1 hypothetical protein NBRC111894_2896 [Sporolactobacillus inulinus]
MIKLLAMDMDGTLLNKHREISWGNLKALRDAHAKGVKLAIASGRAFLILAVKCVKLTWRRI